MNSGTLQALIKPLKKTLKRRVKSLQKHLKKLDLHLLACQKHEQVFHEAELLQSHLYVIKKGENQVVVSDWEKDGAERLISLNPLLKPHDEVKKRFKEAKKLKIGLPFAEAEIEKGALALKNFTAILLQLESIDTPQAFEDFVKKYPLPKPQLHIEKKDQEPKKPYLEFFSKNRTPIWVGKSAAGNDLLTFRFANGNDTWLHVSDYPGSHVVIHQSEEPDEETLQMALQLALRYSKAKNRKEGEISLTKVKYVKRFGREKGKVQISNEKRLFTRLL